MNLRRLFRFLFTHNFSFDSVRVPAPGIILTTLRCTDCGERHEYETLDQRAYLRLYRLKGCPGKPRTAEVSR